MNRFPLLIGLLMLSLALAGCHGTEEGDGATGNGDTNDDDTSMEGDGQGEEPQSLTLTVQDPVSEATVGEPITMTVDVTAEHETTSTHAGFHWSFNSTDSMDPDDLVGGDFDGASPHVTNETTFPGSYTIPEWTFDESHVGTIYVRAHVSADDRNWWGEEFTIEVQSAS